jgi:hypothetical protein
LVIKTIKGENNTGQTPVYAGYRQNKLAISKAFGSVENFEDTLRLMIWHTFSAARAYLLGKSMI